MIVQCPSRLRNSIRCPFGQRNAQTLRRPRSLSGRHWLCVHGARTDIHQQFLQNAQPKLANVSLCMLESPHDCIDRRAEHIWRSLRQVHQRWETVLVDRLNQSVPNRTRNSNGEMRHSSVRKHGARHAALRLTWHTTRIVNAQEKVEPDLWKILEVGGDHLNRRLEYWG